MTRIPVAVNACLPPNVIEVRYEGRPSRFFDAGTGLELRFVMPYLAVEFGPPRQEGDAVVMDVLVRPRGRR